MPNTSKAHHGGRPRAPVWRADPPATGRSSEASGRGVTLADGPAARRVDVGTQAPAPAPRRRIAMQTGTTSRERTYGGRVDKSTLRFDHTASGAPVVGPNPIAQTAMSFLFPVPPHQDLRDVDAERPFGGKFAAIGGASSNGRGSAHRAPLINAN